MIKLIHKQPYYSQILLEIDMEMFDTYPPHLCSQGTTWKREETQMAEHLQRGNEDMITMLKEN